MQLFNGFLIYDSLLDRTVEVKLVKKNELKLNKNVLYAPE